MAMKTYRAKDLYEAFAMIRTDLGENAVLLETREIRKRRFFGLLTDNVTLEILATDEIDEENTENIQNTDENIEKSGESNRISEKFDLLAPETRVETVPETERIQKMPSTPDFWNAIMNQKTQEETTPLNALDSMTFRGEQVEAVSSKSQAEAKSENFSTVQSVGFRKRQRFSETDGNIVENKTVYMPKKSFSLNDNLTTHNSGLLFGNGYCFFDQIANMSQSEFAGISAEFRDALLQIYAKLQTADMDERSITELTTRLREDALLYAATGNRGLNTDLEFLEQKLQELVAQEIQTSGPIPISHGKRRAVALVGPTGVGKTTTIAKLAIDYRQKKNCQVGLITLDLSRMGAVEQLQTFADVIGIPMLCASTRRQVRDAISRMSDFDLVLIDTAGQSRAGDMSLQEMRILFDVADVEDVMLVLSSTTRTRILQQTVEAFSCLEITSLILTKLDESLGLGNLFPLLQTATMPVSYLTNGQKVPDDFETADRMRLARYILGDEQTVIR